MKTSGWAGHSATADVDDDDSDVAGYSAAAVVDVRRVANSTIELPRCEAAESQKSAHGVAEVGSSSYCSIVLCMYRWIGAEKFHNLFTLVV